MPAFNLTWKGGLHRLPSHGPAASTPTPLDKGPRVFQVPTNIITPPANNDNSNTGTRVPSRLIGPQINRPRPGQRVFVRQQRPGKVRVSFSRSSSATTFTKTGSCVRLTRPTGRVGAKAAGWWVGDITRVLLTPKDERPVSRVPRLSKDDISRPQLQEASVEGSKPSRHITEVKDRPAPKYSLMQVPETNPYWGTLSSPLSQSSQNQGPTATTAGAVGRPSEYAHVAPLESVPVSPPKPDAPSQTAKFTIARRPVPTTHQARPTSRPCSSQRPIGDQAQQCVSALSTVSKKEKRFGMADPVVWESVSRTLSQQYRLSNLVSPDLPPEVKDSIDDSCTPSRSPSEKRALERFEHDLKKYANATGASGKVAADPSTATESLATLHTVDELLPFRRQFAAAGLAVTSAEQKGKGKAIRKYRYDTPRDQIDIFQLDGGPSRKSPVVSESSDSTMVHFTTVNDLSHLLVDELPPPKEKHRIQRKLFQPSDKAGTKKTHKSKRWLRNKEEPLSRRSQLEQVVEDEPDPDPTVSRKANTKPLPPIVCNTEKRVESLCKPLPKTRRDVDFATIHYQAPCPTGISDMKVDKKVSKKSGGDPKSQAVSLPDNQPDYERQQTKLSKPHVRYPDSSRQPTGKRKANQTLQHPRASGNSAMHPSESLSDPALVLAGPSTRASRTRNKSEDRRPPPQALKHHLSHTTPSPVPMPAPPSAKPTVPQKSRRRPQPVDGGVSSRKGKARMPISTPKETKEQTSPPPELPFTWRYAVAGSSSLERALDAVRDKLDAESPAPEPVQDAAPAQGKLPPASRSKAKSKLRSPPSIIEEDRKASSLCLNSVGQTVNFHDQDIDDRTVLKGMKMAIAAACDENLDAFVRDRTGMRLRRFFADLTVFEDLEREWNQAQEEAAGRSTLGQVPIEGMATAENEAESHGQKIPFRSRKENEKA